MLQLMDRWWKEAGYDFRMTPYRCMSTNFKQGELRWTTHSSHQRHVAQTNCTLVCLSALGLIEIVLNAKTIASIQKEKGLTSVFSVCAIVCAAGQQLASQDSYMIPL